MRKEDVDGRAEARRPRRRWGRWVGFGLIGLLALLVLGHAFWGWYQEKQLAKEVEELRRKGEPMLMQELVNAPVAEGDNAVILLREAGRSINNTSENWEEFDRLVLDLASTEKEIEVVRRVVEENRGALLKLRLARGKRGVDWQMDPNRSFLLSDIPDIKEQRALAELGAAAILLEHQRGNDWEAVELARDLLAQSDAVEQMPAGLMPHLVGLGISAMACDRMFQICPDLKVGTKQGEVAPAGVKKLIDMLLEESPIKEGQRRAMRVERAGQMQAARSLQSVTPVKKESERKGMSIMGYVMRPLFLKDGRILLRHVTKIMDMAGEAADWPDFRKKAGEEVAQMWMLRQNRAHMLASILAPAYDRFVERAFRVKTERRMAAAALAIRWYAIEHEGRMPGSLEELVPKYLPQVPGDAMGEGKKIGYVAEQERPRLYSVGTNGKDERGSDKPTRKGSDVGRWEREDVVVYLKQQPPEP